MSSLIAFRSFRRYIGSVASAGSAALSRRCTSGGIRHRTYNIGMDWSPSGSATSSSGAAASWCIVCTLYCVKYVIQQYFTAINSIFNLKCGIVLASDWANAFCDIINMSRISLTMDSIADLDIWWISRCFKANCASLLFKCLAHIWLSANFYSWWNSTSFNQLYLYRGTLTWVNEESTHTIP